MTDWIDRQAAIDAALTFIVEYCGAAFDEDMQKMLCERFDALPSAEPKRKTGIWMGSVCSECGNSTSFYYDCDYCPNCGAKMREDND